jgi:hypothetical protein
MSCFSFFGEVHDGGLHSNRRSSIRSPLARPAACRWQCSIGSGACMPSRLWIPVLRRCCGGGRLQCLAAVVGSSRSWAPSQPSPAPRGSASPCRASGWTSPSRDPLPPVHGFGAARQGAVSSRGAGSPRYKIKYLRDCHRH